VSCSATRSPAAEVDARRAPDDSRAAVTDSAPNSSALSTRTPRAPWKALLLENVHASAHELLRADGFEVEAVAGALKPDELARRLAGVHMLGIRSKTRVTAEVLAHAKDLVTLGCFCIGTNQVDLAAANRAGVPVFNAPFSNTRSVAEMILAEVVVLARQLGDRSKEVHAGQWRKVAAGCYEVRHKTLGIVGYGHIGRQIGVIAESLGMHVIFYDTSSKLPMGNNGAARSLLELCAAADFVTLHVPETPQTRGMFGAGEIAAMKSGSYLLNASRGTVVDIGALADALRSGHLAGAAIDVYPEEPETNSDEFKTELRGLANVILTPHVGGSTVEAQAAIGREVATSLAKFASTGATTGAVNFPQVELPKQAGTHRILNVHKNVPGVLRDINRIVSDLEANIRAQVLATDPDTGYLVMDLDKDVSTEVHRQIAALGTNIKTRILT
jgi:D-3-phosphoglycerate dehydrogenase